MKNNSSKILFMSTMLMGINMSMSSSNWMMIWCGLEISLMSFIPLMINKSSMSSESTMKYFIIQSISSAILVLALMIMIMKGDYNYDYMLMTSMLIKTGVPPFHNWLLTVVEGLNIEMIFVLLSINKMAPLTLMSYLMKNMEMIILITIMVGAMMGLNQNSMKSIIGYSSIFNMGFIISIIKFNLMWLSYLIVYSIMMMMLLKIMKNNNMNFINQTMFSEIMMNKLCFWIVILSMGAMPPMLGFSIKYLTMTYMIQLKLYLLVTMMVLTSLLVTFFYIRMTFMSMMYNSLTNKTFLFNYSKGYILIMWINVFTMPNVILMKNLL